MPRDQDTPDQLITLLSLPDKKAVEKFCRQITVTKEDLAGLLFAARLGDLGPYLYANHFCDFVPDHLLPNEKDNGVLAAAAVNGVDERTHKVARKFSQLFEDRRMLSVHLIYDPSKTYWHLFYFDQRDMSPYANHWKKGGAHIHYSRECYVNRSLDEVWADVHGKPPKLPSSEHIRFSDPRERGLVGPGDR